MARFVRGVLRSYDLAAQKRPLVVKSLTSASLIAMGDTISQYVEQSDESSWKIDRTRLLRMTMIGSFMGPTLHYWYGWLDRTITVTGGKAALYKVFFDQGLFAPAILACLTVTIGAAEGKGVSEIKESMMNHYPEALKMNYYIWPPAIFINFNFIPPPFRVLYVSSIGMIWNAILSNITHKTIVPDAVVIEDIE